MTFSLDDAWDNCGPVARAGNAAFGVYCRCGVWVARNISSGHITEPVVPAEVAVAYASPEQARKLVDVGLWEAVDGGWFMPHYLRHNESAEQVAARRKRDAARKAKWRERRESHGDGTRESRGSHGVTPRGVRSSVTTPKGVTDARVAALPSPHVFDNDGTGNCTLCPLPETNLEVHPDAA